MVLGMSVISINTKPSLMSNCRIIEEKDFGFLYDYGTGTIKFLNMTALQILKACDGTNTVEEIVNKLSNAFPDPTRQELECDISEFIQKAITMRIVRK